jgi:hypothetical protein
MPKAGKCLGHAPCPYCAAKAEVKHDKNGHPYLICFDCGDGASPSQHWTRGNAAKIKALLGGGKFTPLPGVELPEWAKAAAPPPSPPKPADPVPPAPPKGKTTVLG